MQTHPYLRLSCCSYDEEADKVNQYQRLNLEGLEKVEIGKKPKEEVKPWMCTDSPNTSPKCA